MVRHTRESGQKSRSGQAEKKPKRTERIAKRLARAGVASRREVERLIGLGLVAVNGRILDTPAVLISTDDIVTVEGKVVGAPEPTRLWRYHKPVGLLTTNHDPKARATVFEHLPEDMPRVVSVGRLDLNSEGLMLLTNDGALARALELPANASRRVYRARALGKVTQAKLDKLADGITVDGVQYGSIEATLDKAKEKDDGRANVWITVALNEGKNREVRRVLEALGLKVNRLLRLAYGPFQLGTLAPGEVEEIGPRVIREQLEEFIAPENMPTGMRTQMAPPSAGRRAGSAMADPRKKPSRVRADDAKAQAEAIERETRAPRSRDDRDDARPRKAFGAGPRRDSDKGGRDAGDRRPPRGDKKPRSEGGFGARKSAGYADKKPRGEGGFGERKPPRKSAGFGDKKPRDEGGFGDRKPPRKSAGYGDKAPRGEGFGVRKSEERRPRSDRPTGARKSGGFGEKRPREESAYGERKPHTFGDRPREGGEERAPRAGFGRGKPRAEAGEKRPYKRREDDGGDRRGGFGGGEKRASKTFGEKRERPAGKAFGKPDGKPGGKPGGYKKADGKPGGFKKTEGFKKADGKPGGFKKTGGFKKSGDFKKAGDKPAGARGGFGKSAPRGERSGPARGPKPAGRGRPGGPKGPGARPSGPRGPKRPSRG
jgi:23S rRNA pseudouridine2605 synthase